MQSVSCNFCSFTVQWDCNGIYSHQAYESSNLESFLFAGWSSGMMLSAAWLHRPAGVLSVYSLHVLLFSKLVIGVNVGVNDRLSFFVSLVIDWRLAQGVPRLSPHDSWDRLHYPTPTTPTLNGTSDWEDRWSFLFVLAEYIFDCWSWCKVLSAASKKKKKMFLLWQDCQLD